MCHVEVREQLGDLCSLLPPCGPWDQTQVVGDNSLAKFVLVKNEWHGVIISLWGEVGRWGLYLVTFAFVLIFWKEQLGAFISYFFSAYVPNLEIGPFILLRC